MARHIIVSFLVLVLLLPLASAALPAPASEEGDDDDASSNVCIRINRPPRPPDIQWTGPCGPMVSISIEDGQLIVCSGGFEECWTQALPDPGHY